jgi:hypothetical protein
MQGSSALDPGVAVSDDMSSAGVPGRPQKTPDILARSNVGIDVGDPQKMRARFGCQPSESPRRQMVVTDGIIRQRALGNQ